MHKFYAPIKIDGKRLIAKLSVEEVYNPGQKDTLKKFYYVISLEIEPTSSVGIGFNHTPIIKDVDSKISVSELYSLVKTYVKDFNPGKPVNPALLNEDGTPMVLYHQTNNQFDTFDIGHEGTGFNGCGEEFGFTIKTVGDTFNSIISEATSFHH